MWACLVRATCGVLDTGFPRLICVEWTQALDSCPSHPGRSACTLAGNWPLCVRAQAEACLPQGGGELSRERGESDRPCRKLEVLLYSQRFPREEGAVVLPSKCALGGIVRRWKTPPREKSPGPAALGTSPLFRKLCGFKDEKT